MGFDPEKAKRDRMGEEAYEEQEKILHKNALGHVLESGSRILDVEIVVKGSQDPVLVFGVKADNLAQAIYKARLLTKLNEKDVIEEQCRAKDVQTGEVLSFEKTVH